MDKKIQLWKSLKQKAPLFYKVGGKHYCIGSCVFCKCTDDETQQHRSYLSEMQRIKELPYAVEKSSDVKLLVNFNSQIKESADKKYDETNKTAASKELQDFIDALTIDDVNSIAAQFEDYRLVIDYADSAFYRRSQK